MEPSNEARRSSFPSSPNRSLNTKSFLGDSMYGSVPFDIFRGLLFGLISHLPVRPLIFRGHDIYNK